MILARYLKFEVLTFYSLSVNHYNLNDKQSCIITGWHKTQSNIPRARDNFDLFRSTRGYPAVINSAQRAMQDGRMLQLNEFIQAVTSLGGFSLGAIGTLLAIFGLIKNNKTQKRAQRIESNQLLSTAWDILGGHSGAMWIFGENNVDDRLEEAKRLIVGALLKDPNYPKAHMYCGVYWQFMGDYGKALDCHRKAIELDNTYSSAYNNLGKTYRQLGNRDAALENYRLALRHNEHFVYARYNLGLTLLDIGDAQGAIAELEQVTQRRHCPAKVHTKLAQAYRKAGFASKADEEFRIALNLASDEEAREELRTLFRGSSP